MSLMLKIKVAIKTSDFLFNMPNSNYVYPTWITHAIKSAKIFSSISLGQNFGLKTFQNYSSSSFIKYRNIITVWVMISAVILVCMWYDRHTCICTYIFTAYQGADEPVYMHNVCIMASMFIACTRNLHTFEAVSPQDLCNKICHQGSD